MWQGGACIQDLVPIMEKIRVAAPEMMKIWEHSLTMIENPKNVIQQIISAEKTILEGLLMGKCKLEDPIIPEHLLTK